MRKLLLGTLICLSLLVPSRADARGERAWGCAQRVNGTTEFTFHTNARAVYVIGSSIPTKGYLRDGYVLRSNASVWVASVKASGGPMRVVVDLHRQSALCP